MIQYEVELNTIKRFTMPNYHPNEFPIEFTPLFNEWLYEKFPRIQTYGKSSNDTEKLSFLLHGLSREIWYKVFRRWNYKYFLCE